MQTRRVYRPFGARLVVVVMAVTLVGAITFLWAAMPAEVRAQFTWPQRITILLFFAAILLALWGMFRTSVTILDSGLVITNIFKVRSYDWAQVLAISLHRGDPWAVLDLSDGTSVVAMAIQGSDGARTNGILREIGEQIEKHSPSEGLG
ncbi:MAG: PH domain-containing protein [Nocardioidaceae bacterium]